MKGANRMMGIARIAAVIGKDRSAVRNSLAKGEQWPRARYNDHPPVSDSRTIFHVDMDAFFASVEQLDHPSLRGKPVLVGYDGPRGVVAAASYESRVFGCRSAQPMAVAKRLCPHAVVVPVHFTRYREISAKVFRIFESYTPAVEPLSVDEAFLDLSGCERLLGDDFALIARQLKQRIHAELGLTASVGVAPNKFLAKLASDMNKPDGLTIIRAQDVRRLLDPMPVGKLWGIGPKTASRLADIGIKTVADLLRVPLEVLSSRLGADADHYRNLAMGLDDRPVVSDREAKSIGHEQTFGVDLADADAVRDVMLEQCEQVGAAAPPSVSRAVADGENPLRRFSDHHPPLHAPGADRCHPRHLAGRPRAV
jgi:DNA polymerase IV